MNGLRGEALFGNSLTHVSALVDADRSQAAAAGRDLAAIYDESREVLDSHQKRALWHQWRLGRMEGLETHRQAA